jgi:hypothetical protein
MIGRTLGHYRIVEPLGAGGMGEVFRAHDEKLDRDVAVKVLPEGALSDEEARQRSPREANALSRVSHPHIATIFDFDSLDGVDGDAPLHLPRAAPRSRGRRANGPLCPWGGALRAGHWTPSLREGERGRAARRHS